MPTTLVFDQIADERFGDTIDTLKEINKNILSELAKHHGVAIKVDPVRELTFNYPKDEAMFISFRQTYYVQKNTRKITWNDIYASINKIKAVYYKRYNLTLNLF